MLTTLDVMREENISGRCVSRFFFAEFSHSHQWVFIRLMNKDRFLCVKLPYGREESFQVLITPVWQITVEVQYPLFSWMHRFLFIFLVKKI